MALIDVKGQYEDIKKSAIEAVRSIFPVEKKEHKLILNEVWVEDDAQIDNYADQAKVKAKGGSWGANVYVDLSLIDIKSNKIINREKKIKLFLLPKLTPRASYIVKGNEYQVANQLRLKSGAYVKRMKGGGIKTQFNMAKGGSAELHINDNGVIQMKVGQGKIPLFPLLVGMGISESAIRSAWGDKVLLENKDVKDSPQNAVKRLASSIAQSKTTNFETAKDNLKTYIQDKTEILPDMTKLTLGKEHSTFSPMLWLDASKKLIDVQRGKEDPDDVDNLAFKEFFGVDDAIKERIEKNKNGLVSRIRRNLDSRDEIKKIINIGTFGDLVETFFTDDDRASTPEQINPLHMYAGHEKVTFLGPGALGSTKVTTDEMRNVHPTHLSFLDPVHTPECYDEKTEVFTSKGWKYWKDVDKNDKFACLVENRMVYEHPERLVAKEYSGIMYGAKNSKIDYLVTPNHKMLVRPLDSNKDSWRDEYAEETHGKPRTFKLTHSAMNTNSLVDFKFPKVESGNAAKEVDKVDQFSWAGFLGWFLSEGDNVFDEKSKNYRTRISQSKEANSDNCALISKLLSNMPWKWSFVSGDTFTLSNKQLSYVLKDQGYSYQKFIPEYVFGFSNESKRHLLDTFLYGDGRSFSNRKKGKSYKQEVYCTTSKKLANGIERLLIELGESVSTKVYSDDREDRYRDVYEVRVQQRKIRSARPYNRRSKRNDYYTVDYNGKVYCATVPGGYLLVRRNGSLPMWLGNSDRIGLNLALTLGAKKEGKVLKSSFYNVKTKKTEQMEPLDVYEKVIAYPDQWDRDAKKFKTDKVKAQLKGKLVIVPPSQVEYIMPFAQNAFSLSTNMIPFMANDNGNRTMMAGKHMEQAIPLRDREIPFVQNKMPVKGNVSFEEAVGSSYAVYATKDGTKNGEKISGTVTSVTKNHINIKTEDGQVKIPIYDNFPLNQKTFMNHEPQVKAGDSIEEGQLLADTNYTRNGTLSLGRNLRAAYIPYKGYNFEDGIVITEGAAQKLTSEHIHKKQMGITSRTILNLGKYLSYFPNEIALENRQKLDETGVVKKGSTVSYGDTIIAGMRDRGEMVGAELIKARLHKSLGKTMKDVSEKWGMEVEGIVTDVQRTGDQISVFIKTEEPAKIGDKLAGRHGNKGIITKIIPDAHAPRNADDEPVEILLNPHGVISRINIGQMFESAVGKVAKKTGTPYKVENFSGENYLDTVKKELSKNNIEDVEELTDPLSGKSLGKVHVGDPYILKLNKQSEVNFSVRGESGPVAQTTMQPVRGGSEGSKAVDMLTMYSLLSHGARANLKEMATLKSENNPEFWEALKYGKHLPAPKAPFVFDRFVNMLKGSGVDVKKDGSRFQLAPLTDDQVRKVSKLEIDDPQFARASGDKIIEHKGGLIDPVRLGGMQGDGWGHIKLKEAMPNPIFEEAIKTLTGLVKDDYSAILTGKKTLDINGEEITGPQAIKARLEQIDVQKQLKELKPQLDTLRGNNLDKAVKKYRLLKALNDNDLTPVKAYMRELIPVVPPKFRPMSIMESGDIAADDTNILYRNVGLISKQMKLPVVDLLDDADLKDVRYEMDRQLKGLAGLVDTKFAGRDKRGFIAQLKGKNQPKEGFYQSKVLRKNQNLVGRGTIIPEPQLHMDEAAIPEQMAWKLYSPFVIKELIKGGLTATRAKQEIDNKSPLARNALDRAMGARPLMLNRAPSLHKFSVMAFKPKITDGKAIKIPPLVVSGFNADFDGDQQIGKVLVLIDNSDLMRNYSSTIFSKELIMTSRFKEKLPYFLNGEVFIVDLEDFPHGELIGQKNGKKGPIDFYQVPEGVKVLSLDEKSGDVSWQQVAGWSRHKDREVEIVTLSSGYQIITDDDPRAVYGVKQGTLDYVRLTPEESMKEGIFVPRVKNINTENQSPLTQINVTKYFTTNERSENMLETIPLNRYTGYVIGAICGDGWVSEERQTVLANIDKGVTGKYREALKSFFNPGFTPHLYESESMESYGESKKLTFSNLSFSRLLVTLVGKGAESKHLPSFFLNASQDFREGLFAGLMDTDGSISVSYAKSKPQLMSNYGSNSIRLIHEVQLLARSIGVDGRITSSKTPAGLPCWVLSFSSMDIKNQWGGKFMGHNEKLLKLASVPYIENSAVTAKYDIVPISYDLSDIICKEVGAKRDAPKDQKSFYAVFHKAKTTGSVSRHMATKVAQFCNLIKLSEVEEFKKWVSLVENSSIKWDKVESYEKTNIKETGFDLTVPGFETFMNVEGIILSNTMTVHIPVGDKAVREAHKMFPSRNLYKPGTGSLMVGPTQESQLGFYLLSKDEEGRKKLNDILPDTLDIRGPMGKKESKELFERLAKELPNEVFAKVIDTIKIMGEDAAFEKGFSLSLKDIETIPGKEVFLKELEREAAKVMSGKDSLDVFSEKLLGKGGIQERLDANIDKHFKGSDNSFYEMVTSGARGNMSQLRQIVASPLIVQDPNGNPIPKPIEKSFSEGLDLSDYWIASYGARKGMMDRALATQEPGVFNKSLMAATMNNVVSMEDCKTEDGITMKVDDDGILGRFLQGDHKGINDETVIDDKVLSSLKSKNYKEVFVRSPLKCKAPKGTCRHCYGIDENGQLVQVGDNLGAKAAQTISEPLTQMTMNCEDGLVQVGEKYIPFKDLYEDVLGQFEEGDDGHCTYRNINQEVRSKFGTTLSPVIQRHMPDDELFFIKTKSGNTLICQGNHPLFIKENPLHPRFENSKCRIIGEDIYVDSVSRIPFKTDHKVKEIFTRDIEKYDAIWIDNSCALKSHNLLDLPIPGYVAGLYAAEGSTRVGNGTEKYVGRDVAIVITQEDNQIKKSCVKHASSLDPKPSTKEVQFYGQEICKKFHSVVRGRYSWEKRLHYDFNLYSPEWLKDFLEGLIDGDGTVFEANGITVGKIYTSSYYLLQQIQVIAIKLGLKHNSTLVAKQKKAHRPHFAIELRFPEEYKKTCSEKLPISIKPFVNKKEVVISGFDVITTIKPLWKWNYFVYDLKTESQEFMLGGVQCHNTFHTGGVAGSGKKGGYQRIQELINMPKQIKVGKATLAVKSGVIEKIEQSGLGGHNIFIDGIRHTTGSGLKLKVKKGDTVKKGDPLSDGSISPQEMLDLKGMKEVQDYMTDELKAAYESQGININRKTFETVVKSITDRTEVLNDIDDLPYFPGDNISLSAADDYNKNRGNKEALRHKPYLTGVKYIPHKSQDWMAQMGATQIPKAIINGASQGWFSDTKDYHPIPAFAYGASFGDGEDGRY